MLRSCAHLPAAAGGGGCSRVETAAGGWGCSTVEIEEPHLKLAALEARRQHLLRVGPALQLHVAELQQRPCRRSRPQLAQPVLGQHRGRIPPVRGGRRHHRQCRDAAATLPRRCRGAHSSLSLSLARGRLGAGRWEDGSTPQASAGCVARRGEGHGSCPAAAAAHAAPQARHRPTPPSPPWPAPPSFSAPRPSPHPAAPPLGQGWCPRRRRRRRRRARAGACRARRRAWRRAWHWPGRGRRRCCARGLQGGGRMGAHHRHQQAAWPGGGGGGHGSCPAAAEPLLLLLLLLHPLPPALACPPFHRSLPPPLPSPAGRSTPYVPKCWEQALQRYSPVTWSLIQFLVVLDLQNKLQQTCRRGRGGRAASGEDAARTTTRALVQSAPQPHVPLCTMRLFKGASRPTHTHLLRRQEPVQVGLQVLGLQRGAVAARCEELQSKLWVFLQRLQHSADHAARKERVAKRPGARQRVRSGREAQHPRGGAPAVSPRPRAAPTWPPPCPAPLRRPYRRTWQPSRQARRASASRRLRDGGGGGQVAAAVSASWSTLRRRRPLPLPHLSAAGRRVRRNWRSISADRTRGKEARGRQSEARERP